MTHNPLGLARACHEQQQRSRLGRPPPPRERSPVQAVGCRRHGAQLAGPVDDDVELLGVAKDWAEGVKIDVWCERARV